MTQEREEAKSPEAGSPEAESLETGSREPGSLEPESHVAEPPEAESHVAASPNGKWTKRGAAERREHIAQTAAKLLLEGGSERLTHRRVAAAAGVPLGSTTQYFKSIDELRRAGLQYVAKSLDEDIEEMSQRLKAIDGDLDALAGEFCDCLCDAKSVNEEMALYRGALNDPEVRDMFERFEWQFIDQISGYASPDVTRLLSALWDGIAISTYLTGRPFDRELITGAIKALVSMDADSAHGADNAECACESNSESGASTAEDK